MTTGANLDGCGSPVGVDSPSIDHTSKPASLPLLENAKTPKQ
jgi:hypothetical protein